MDLLKQVSSLRLRITNNDRQTDRETDKRQTDRQTDTERQCTDNVMNGLAEAGVFTENENHYQRHVIKMM